MLISAVITEVISEVGGDTDDTDLAGKMLIFAKGALRRFPLFSKARLLYITSYATLQAGTNYLTTPTFFLNERSVWYELNGARKIIDKVSDDQFARIVNTDTRGTISYYRIYNNVIEFNILTDTERTIYVEHLAQVDAITADTNFFGTTDMLEIMKDGMKSTYYSDYVEDKVTGREKLALFKAGLDELETRHMIQTMGTHIGD